MNQHPGYKQRGGNKSKSSDKKRSNQNGRKDLQGGSKQFYFPDNHGTAEVLTSSSRERGMAESSTNQRQRNSHRESPRVRAFNMSKNSGFENETDQNLTGNEAKVTDSRPSHTTAENLYSVETESGSFECASILFDSNKPNQIKSKDAKHANERAMELCKKSCITEIDDDLFNAPENVSLAHCVGADFRMGAGIALKFKQKFKSTGKLLDQRVGPGGVAFIHSLQRHLFYLVTKQASTDKPKIDTLRQSLIALRKKCHELCIVKLAMPRIGCGLDQLSWEAVKSVLEEIFNNNFEITVYNMDLEYVKPPKPEFRVSVVHKEMFLKDIDHETALLYIGYENSDLSEDMKSLNERYPFFKNLTSSSYKPGSTFVSAFDDSDPFYGLICKKSVDSPLNYNNLESAIHRMIQCQAKSKFQHHYFGLQAYEEKNDPYVMEKIETLLRNATIDAEFWICWPPFLWEKRQSNTKKKTGQQQPFTGASKSSSSIINQNVCQATGENENSSEENWFERNEFPELLQPSKNSDDIGGQEWVDEFDIENPRDPESYAEDERKKSQEKKQMIQQNKEKAKEAKNRIKPKSCVTECKGDLFDAEDTLCLAHCVGADFKMGSGIAVLFRQKFGAVDELLDQRVSQGGVAHIYHKKRFIFYLVTKRESTGKPTYEVLKKSLLALYKKCKELGVTELGMPRIGCGLDRLEWRIILPMLEEIFADGFTIRVFNLEKDYQETKQTMPNTFIKHNALYLKDIQKGTGLLYIGSVEPFTTEEMKSLDEKYTFLPRLSRNKPKLGSVVRTEASYPREVVYGLICKQSAKDRINFVKLKAALKELKTINKADAYGYFGIQAFKDGDDDNIMGKIETMLRYSYMNVEVWICYPPSFVNSMPRTSSARESN